MSELDRQIETHIPRLRRYARALLRDTGAADDLVQDTLERAWSRWSLWGRGSDLRAWLFAIMHNVFVNQVESAQARHDRLAEPLDDMELPVRATQEDGLAVRDLHEAIGRLPPEFREVILLVGLEEMKYEEVAKILHIPLGTVMSRLSRGRKQLRGLLEDGAPPPRLRRVK